MYGLMLLVAIAACVALTGVRYVRRGGDWDLVLRVAVWGVAAGIVGARLYHDITSWDEVPDPKWKGVFEVWKGGLGVWGGIFFGCIAGWIVVRRSGRSAAVLADAAAPGLLLAQGIGRIGNWFNQELYGKPTDSAVGARDRPGASRHRLRAVRHVPPDLPLRAALRPDDGRGAAARSTGGSGSGRRRSSRSTSPSTRSGASSRSCCASTRRTSSRGCG